MIGPGFEFYMPVVVASITAVAGIIIYLISVFGIREKTFEEAIASQKEISQELLGKKDQQKKKVVKRKVKSKKDENVSKGYKEKEKDSDKESKEKESPHGHQHHVEIRDEPTIILHEDGAARHSSVGLPVVRRESIKSILVNKSEMSPIGDGDLGESNHFENRHPKDDLELRRQISTEDELPLEQSDDVEISNVEEEIIEAVEALQVGSAPSAANEALTSNVTRKGSKKTKKAAPLVPSTGELNVTSLVSVIDKVMLSKDEIQDLIEYLLNRQVDASVASEWVNKSKSDTTVSLKKTLAERDAQLSEEKVMVEALQQKLKDARQEFSVEKSRLSGIKKALEDRSTTLQQESQQFQIRIQQLNTMLSDKAGLERQIQDFQRRTQALHDENLNLKKVLNADQGFRMKADALEREAEALRTQCSHLESQLKSSFQSNSDLAAQALGQEQHIRGLEMKVADFENLQGFSVQLQERETHLLNELKHAEGKILEGDAEKNLLRDKLRDTENEMRASNEESERKVEESHQSEKNAKNLLHDNKTSLALVENQLKAKELELMNLQEEKNSSNDELLSHNKKLEEDGLALEKRLGLADGKVILLTAEKEALNETISKKKEEIRGLNQKLTELHEEKSKLVENLLLSESNLEAQTQAAKSHLDEIQITTRHTTLNSIQEELETASGIPVQKSSEAWIESFVQELNSKVIPPSVDNSQVDRLQGEVVHYQTTLRNTESILSNLEKSIADSEKAWEEELKAKNTELEAAHQSSASQVTVGHLEVELNLQREANSKLVQLNKDLEETLSKSQKEDAVSIASLEELKVENEELRAEVHRLANNSSHVVPPTSHSPDVSNGNGNATKPISASPSTTSVESKHSGEAEPLSPTSSTPGETKKKKKAASAKKERKT